ncbi:MAG: CTP synthase, partial [Candidatus Subteraquimicrobiales bacterium]|nr:CTP synthase [Candidatus Subteraquimicrobiales bacterium]
MAKHVFVTGGVVSSLGKGITSASLGYLLKASGLIVVVQKFDPYLNFDPGTMNPFQHGEVFVTEDGTETDLDLGHYERFIDENLSRECNVTAGQIYWTIVTKEREGKFLGATVQVIPHVTNEIKEKILNLDKKNQPDVVITEIGGTVGDIESLPFLEAIRQLREDIGKGNVLYIHVTLVPFLETAQELKTKPTQHSVKELRSIGIQPDIIICRSDRLLTEGIKKKIALFCDVEPREVISALNAESIYEVPLLLHTEEFDAIVKEHLGLKVKKPDLSEWEKLVKRVKGAKEKVKIAIAGKYVRLPDAYISIAEALNHAGFYHGAKVEVSWVDTETIKPAKVKEKLVKFDGVLVPGGFGVRGIEGKIQAINYVREGKIPFLGICLGLQCA